MNCPNCKNPIQDNSTECEWCGSELTNKNDYLNTPSSATSNKDLKAIMIMFSWLLMFIGVLGSLIAFYRIEVVKNYGSNDLYYSALLIPLGLFIKIINKYEK